MASPRQPPVLVTGLPRSGTTWLARALSAAPGTALPGREPMNPRAGQFGLGGHLTSWVRRESLSGREAALLKRCYRGRELRAFSRYGNRQWRAPLPFTRVIVKDPFALLSIPAVRGATGATPVVVYRHPAAVIASYRRMGWRADTEELVALGAPAPCGSGDVEAMIAMWVWCYDVVLEDLRHVSGAIVVSHSALASDGTAVRRLGCQLGLQVPPVRRTETDSPVQRSPADSAGLHDFTRSPSELETGWRSRVRAEEIAEIEAAAANTWQALEAAQLDLHAPSPSEEVA